jgi:DNA-binding LacI/PurR family transcriptional regulator
MIGNTEASVEAVRHLVGLGHRRIAYLGDRHGHQSDTERFAGYRRALEEAGLEYDPELVAHGNGKAEGAAAPMQNLLGIVPPPTAVFCYNDMSALGAIRAIRAHGLRVPADISIVGFDDLPIMQFMDPPLTTVCQPMRQMGRLAVQTLARLVAGEVFENNIIVPGRLVVRNSTAPPGERTA